MDNKTLEQIKEQYADYIAALGEEDKAKVEACKTAEELIALADNTEGELPDDIAEAVAGGKGKSKEPVCPYPCWCTVIMKITSDPWAQVGSRVFVTLNQWGSFLMFRDSSCTGDCIVCSADDHLRRD